jgi:restriction system protein
MTKGSGDQGADVIAEKGGIRVVVQCKWYSQPVGNAAVQEAYAAKAHERTDYAFVVTNNAYTKSAKQLAASTGVGLLHANDLRDFFKATGLGEGVGQAAGWPRP